VFATCQTPVLRFKRCSGGYLWAAPDDARSAVIHGSDLGVYQRITLVGRASHPTGAVTKSGAEGTRTPDPLE